MALATSVLCHGGKRPPLMAANERVLVLVYLEAQAVIFPPDEIIWCSYGDRDEWADSDRVFFVVKGSVIAECQKAEPDDHFVDDEDELDDQFLDDEDELDDKFLDDEDEPTTEVGIEQPGSLPASRSDCETDLEEEDFNRSDPQQERPVDTVSQKLTAGSSFGEKQMFLRGDFEVRQSSFIANEHTDIYSMDRALCRQIMEKDKQYVQGCMQVLSEREFDFVLAEEVQSIRRSVKRSMAATRSIFMTATDDFFALAPRNESQNDSHSQVASPKSSPKSSPMSPNRRSSRVVGRSKKFRENSEWLAPVEEGTLCIQTLQQEVIETQQTVVMLYQSMTEANPAKLDPMLDTNNLPGQWQAH